MKIRSEILAIAENIRSFAHSCAKSKIIDREKILATIADFNKQIHEKMSLYDVQEKSLKGRIKTAQNLADALNLLSDKTRSHTIFLWETILQIILNQIVAFNIILDKNDVRPKELTQALARVKKSITDSENLFAKLNARIPPIFLARIESDLDKSINLRLIDKLVQDAFRTIKNFKSIDLNLFDEDVKTPKPFSGYLHLKNDLELFLSSYGPLLTEPQRNKISQIILLLDKSFELDKKISTVFEIKESGNDSTHKLIELYSKEKDLPLDEQRSRRAAILIEVLEARLDDIVYEVEISIEKLDVGQKFIFPGGLYQNRYVLFEVHRVAKDDYHFAVINTGKEANYGQSIPRSLALKWGLTDHAAVPLFSGLPIDALTDSDFLKTLIRFETQTGIPNLRDSVYATIQKQLTEKYPGKQSTRNLYTIQEWGPTSFDPVLAYIEYALPPSLFIPFQFDMMLRARSDLNQAIPQASKDHLFAQSTLDYIDKKSCETIAESRKKFDQYCNAVLSAGNKFELPDISLEDMKDITAFKEYVKKLQTKLHNTDFWTEFFGNSFAIIYFLAFLSIGNLKMELIPLPGSPNSERALVGLSTLMSLLSITLHSNYSEKGMISEKNMLQFLNLLKEITPDDHTKFLQQNELSAWTSKEAKTRAGVSKISLDSFLEILTDKLAGIALCSTPALTNSTYTPLNTALQGCNMLLV